MHLGALLLLLHSGYLIHKHHCQGGMSGLGCRVLVAPDGAEALRIFGEYGTEVDLLLVDVVLSGGMRGDELARRLGEIRPALRTLFMSGYTENPIVHRDHFDNGVQLLGKLFQWAELARKVAEMLGGARADAAISRVVENAKN
jgi:CheY-like chemotaxis protein